MRIALMAVVSLLLPLGAFARDGFVTRGEYLDLVEAAVCAYSDEHIAEYTADADANGVHEHGFPRLASNLGVLIAAGRMPERKAVFCRMMDICCRDAKKGPMKYEGNEFSVKELVAALVEVERAGVVPKEKTDAWRRDLAEIDPWRCYKVKPELGNTEWSYNWCVFGCASEQMRIAAGLGGDPKFVERYVSDQSRWFDEKGMWRDPHEPAVYDLVTRLQFALVLSAGYDGPSRAALEGFLDRGANDTLKLQSAAGEIPYGGRSNQFLHNDTLYAALCEWYASRAARRGDMAMAARFRLAAGRAVDSLKGWLCAKPVRHVKNMYPRGAGKRGTGIGCEGYAYFDKYMVTMGSWAALAMRFASEVPPLDFPRAWSPEGRAFSFATTPFFHFVFLDAGGYSAQFDYRSDSNYDCDGMGRLHRLGAPTAICLSTPCAAKPRYSTERPNDGTLAFVPIGGGELLPAGNGSDGASAWANWKMGEIDWECRLSKAGLSSSLKGPGEVAMQLPAFEFDGASAAGIVCDGKTLSVSYRGWVCRYSTDGAISDSGRVCCNRNGRYRVFEARGFKSLAVRVEIVPDPGQSPHPVCDAGVCPERQNDFFWENDKFGMRAYGPGEYHKWSGWDVFNKAVDAEASCGFLLHNAGKCGNWHVNPFKGVLDNYTMCASRGVGGVAFWGDGEWKTYPDWESAKVLHTGDDYCEFELVYPAFAAAGKMTCYVTLKRGDRFFRCDVRFEHPERFRKDFRAGPGIDLDSSRDHKGVVVEEDGLVSLFEDEKGSNGSTMEAIFVAPGEAVEVMTDHMNCRVLAFNRPSFTYWAGATWSKAGEIATPQGWIEAVRKFRSAVVENSPQMKGKCK